MPDPTQDTGSGTITPTSAEASHWVQGSHYLRMYVCTYLSIFLSNDYFIVVIVVLLLSFLSLFWFDSDIRAVCRSVGPFVSACMSTQL